MAKNVFEERLWIKAAAANQVPHSCRIETLIEETSKVIVPTLEPLVEILYTASVRE
jgi:hypothetical protein